MKTLALIEMGGNGTYSVFTPDIDSMIYGEGSSVAEAKADFLNTYAEMVAFAEEDGEELPDSLKDLTFTYKFDIASLFNYFNFINVSKFAKLAGINESLMRQYKMGGTYISEVQTKKIEKALHGVADEFAAIRLL